MRKWIWGWGRGEWILRIPRQLKPEFSAYRFTAPPLINLVVVAARRWGALFVRQESGLNRRQNGGPELVHTGLVVINQGVCACCPVWSAHHLIRVQRADLRGCYAVDDNPRERPKFVSMFNKADTFPYFISLLERDYLSRRRPESTTFAHCRTSTPNFSPVCYGVS
jgi:hypothetical protein